MAVFSWLYCVVDQVLVEAEFSFSSIAYARLVQGHSCLSNLICVLSFLKSLVYARHRAFCPTSHVHENFSPVYSTPKCHIVAIHPIWSGTSQPVAVNGLDSCSKLVRRSSTLVNAFESLQLSSWIYVCLRSTETR